MSDISSTERRGQAPGGARLGTLCDSSLDLRNVFSGNNSCGVAVTVEGASENKVFCNFVSTDVKTVTPIPIQGALNKIADHNRV
jgi:hypothetical protein